MHSFLEMECYLKYISRNENLRKRTGCVIDKNIKLDICINNFKAEPKLERLHGFKIVGKIVKQNNSYILEIASSENIKPIGKKISVLEDAEVVESPKPANKVNAIFIRM